MRCVTAVLLTLAFSSFGEDLSDSSGIDVIEVFRAETPGDLEASLSDGYPMPWLEEILNDGSIPEEDRYWLDCRVRAVIAQDLHLFFDREGNPVHVEADWIRPGEDYWRENFIVNPPGEPFLFSTPDRPSNVTSEPGFVVNRFGEEVGRLAMTDEDIRLSRDGSIGVTCSGLPSDYFYLRPVSTPTYACILYSDGSFKEVKIGFSDDDFYAISNDGNTIVVASYLPVESFDDYEKGSMLWILNRDGSIKSTFEADAGPQNSPVAVSATGKYVAYVSSPFENNFRTFLFNGVTGNQINCFDGIVGHYLYFTPNEKYFCIMGLSAQALVSTSVDQPLIYDCDNSETVWEMEVSEANRSYSFLNCDNNAQTVVMREFIRGRPTISQQLIYDIESHDINILHIDAGLIQISPNAGFTMSQNYTELRNSTNETLCSTPLVVCRIGGGR